MEEKKITPRKLAGFWELDPEKEYVFEYILDKIKDVFYKHAFLPLDTPVMELSEILLAKSGGDLDKEIYRFEKGSTDACLRYDFTVPLARYVAMKEGELSFPFKRFQIGKVYRGERPQKGRYREFYQCDADIIGFEKLSLVADAECISLYEDVFSSLGLKCNVEISSRKILFGIINDLKQDDKFNLIASALDKFEKIGNEETNSLLKDIGLNEKERKILLKYIKINGKFVAIKSQLQKLSKNEIFLQGLAELEQIENHLNSIGIENYIYNMAIIRGHNYYTSCVFEVFLDGMRNLGAMGGGGRYENLAEYFTDKKLPGVGMSIGISRLFDVITQNNLIKIENNKKSKVSIIPLGDNLSHCLNLCTKLRNNSIACEVLFEEKSFKSKLKDANRSNVPFIIIIGDDEVSTKKYTIKNMKTGEQNQASYEEILNMLR